MWRLLGLAADWPARVAGEEAGADEATVRMQTARVTISDFVECGAGKLGRAIRESRRPSNKPLEIRPRRPRRVREARGGVETSDTRTGTWWRIAGVGELRRETGEQRRPSSQTKGWECIRESRRLSKILLEGRRRRCTDGARRERA